MLRTLLGPFDAVHQTCKELPRMRKAAHGMRNAVLGQVFRLLG